MTTGLPVSRLINVGVSLTPQGAQFANLSSLLILGDSDVIDVGQRIRTYASANAIATDFGNTSPEYLAAKDFFAPTPSPTSVMVGRWAKAATAGRLVGTALTPTQQALTNFTAISTGSLKLTIDGGAATTITGINLSAVTNMNGIATLLQTALAAIVAGTTCVWTGTNFQIKSPTTGASSSVAFPVAPGSGTDLKTLLGLTAVQGARSVNGIVAESALTAVQILDALPTFWYGLMFAVPAGDMVDADHIAIAGYIEGDTLGPHLYGLTSQATTVPDATQTSDIASVLTAAGYKRTFGMWSSTDPYAVAEMFGALLTVNYAGSDTTINMMYQQLPGITAENLTVSQANTLDVKRINYSAIYANGVAILEDGVMFGGAYIDEMAGADWLGNYVQTNIFNLFATVKTKIPQTDKGTNQIVNNINKSMGQAVNNGFLAPGTWDAAGFGQLAQGDFLPTGFYVFAPPVASQASADRQARKSVPIQIAGKLAGATDSANVLISVNR